MGSQLCLALPNNINSYRPLGRIARTAKFQTKALEGKLRGKKNYFFRVCKEKCKVTQSRFFSPLLHEGFGLMEKGCRYKELRQQKTLVQH